MALKNSLDATQILPLTRLDHCCAQSDDETRIQFCIQRLMSFDKLNRKYRKCPSSNYRPEVIRLLRTGEENDTKIGEVIQYNSTYVNEFVQSLLGK